MEDYVSFEQSQRLKELGFDWECNHIYKKDFFNNWIFFHCLQDAYENHNQGGKSEPTFISAPTLSQTQKWLREVKRIHVWVESEPNEYDNSITYAIYIWDNNKRQYPENYNGIESRNTYESALQQGIDEALELLKID